MIYFMINSLLNELSGLATIFSDHDISSLKTYYFYEK